LSVLPFERLRALARHAGDDTELVLEAADCLADFGHDPAQVVTVCRRLLAHHPANGPLWWLCARVVAGSDPADAARAAERILETDRTASRLASLLPFPHDEVIAVLGWPEIAGAALAERPDLDVVAIRRRDGDTHLRARLTRSDTPVRVVDETEAMALTPSHLLIEVLATDPTTALVPAGTVDLLWSLSNTPIWLVVAAGRLLPQRLFEVAHAEIERQDLDIETIDVNRAAQVAGPNGLETPDRLIHRIDCPIAPELLRL
jgi:hypothetical protein